MIHSWRNSFVLILVLCLHSMFCSAQIGASSWQGTGWALNNGYVVTNYHVIDGARTLKVKCVIDDSVYQYVGEVAVADEEHDLAIIQINDRTFKGFKRIPYALKTEQAEVGESIFVLGYPLTQLLGDEIKLTTGIISARTGFQGDATSYQLSAPIQPGNSGGPLFDDNGNVIAVVNAKVSTAENVGYAIKAKYVKELVAQLPSPAGVLPQNHDLVGKSLPEKVKALQSFIFTIYASTQASPNPRPARPTTPTAPNQPSIPGSRGSSGGNGSHGNYENGSRAHQVGGRIIEWPYVDRSRATTDLKLKKLTLTETETILEFVYTNRTSNGYYSWISIAPQTYVVAMGTRYRLRRAVGIALSPERTYFQGATGDVNFQLVFPALPQGVLTLDFIEPESDWQMYGISTKQ